MKYTPLLVGAAVGFVDGEITEMPSVASHKYAHGIFKFGALAAGAMGEMFFGWNQNVDYGLMTAASTLIGARIPAAFSQKKFSAIATYTAPTREQPATGGQSAPTIAGHVAAGCTACAKHAAPLAMPTTAASRAHPYTSASLGSDYRQREQLPTGAG